MENEIPTEPFMPGHYPVVTLMLPTDEEGLTPEQAVEEFIHIFNSNSPRQWRYLVDYGPKKFSVDMETIPVTVEEISR